MVTYVLFYFNDYTVLYKPSELELNFSGIED